MAPVAQGTQVAEVEAVLQAECDAGDGTGDLARDEGLAAHRTLVIEEDAVAGIDAVGFAVVDGDPVGVELGDRIRTARVERRRLLLRNFLDEAVEFRGARLVEAGLLLEAEDADRLEHAQRADAVGVGGVLGFLEADGDVALRGQIVDLVRLHLLDDADQARRVGQVTVVEDEAAILLVRVLVQVVDTVGVEQRAAPLDAVDLVALGQQHFGQIGAILAGNAGDQGNLSLRGHAGSSP
ncbi:MAG: hypothetical protein AW07_00315 [Candidatus Accumulibacter sp. SK-11]|nr:MAG: hypothetical protein AW07_00315 [Candidatus Accumulibacter sp. SK-11]